MMLVGILDNINNAVRPIIRPREIQQAVKCLKQGGLVAMPTETVYGLAADATNELAVRKIFTTKGRPADHPLIVHIAHITHLSQWAKDIPDYALALAKQFWPGPITLILKKQTHVLDSVTGGQNTVGIRIPNHPVAQALLRAFDGGVAAPSANRFGYISPTSAEHVRQDLGQAVDIILDGGHCGIGIESTIVNCTGTFPHILRPGMITPTMIHDTLNLNLDLNYHGSENTLVHANNAVSSSCETHPETLPQVSGALPSHYAPRTKTRLLPAECIDTSLKKGACLKNIVILSRRKPHVHHAKIYDSRIPHRIPLITPHPLHWICMPANPYGYAHCLYEQLHFADHLQCIEIWIEEVPATPEWQGIRDRITKASFQTNA